MGSLPLVPAEKSLKCIQLSEFLQSEHTCVSTTQIKKQNIISIKGLCHTASQSLPILTSNTID